MAGRAFRARPLDNHKPLDIVRDESLLDSTEGLPAREVVHNHAALDAENEKPKMVQDQNGNGGKEIPIPGVTRVPTYELDYLPTFHERNTYLRGRGGVGYEDPTFVEYDIDPEDEAWLAAFNGDQVRLSETKLETMLWKLDVANAAATDRIFSFQGAPPAERLTEHTCASTDHLQRDEALQMLEETCPSHKTIRAAVYEYWLQKRKKLGRPLLRRLQAPTPLNDKDPYRVFRPRERIHRPQTRRRRENNVDSLEKLNMIKDNVSVALSLFELIVRRERKKRDMTYVVTDWQQLQIKQRHEARSGQDAVEQEYQAAAKKQNHKRPVGFDTLPEAAPAATNALLDFKNKKNKKRKKLGMEPQMNAVSHMPPDPQPPQPNAVFAALPSDLQLAMRDCQQWEQLPQSAGNRWHSRIGRGGRLILDRCRPFTLEPLSEGEDARVEAMHTLPNPYLQWLTRHDLAQAAIARLDAQAGQQAAQPRGADHAASGPAENGAPSSAVVANGKRAVRQKT